jgi:two-component system sensor histidine kinase KdpD
LHSVFSKSKGRFGMSTIEHFSLREESRGYRWLSYLFDSALAIIGALLVTTVIFFWHLYPRIPNISIVYLLVVLALASTRGRYAAIVASVAAFLAFDFFIVPPIYTFTMYRPEEWIALFVFLTDAILTGHLASSLRFRAQQAARREHETRILYDLVRKTAQEEDSEYQLQVIAHAIVEVFSSWGIQECAILQTDESGTVQLRASTTPKQQTTLSADERVAAAWVMSHGQSVRLDTDISPSKGTSTRFVRRILADTTHKRHTQARHTLLLPLQMGLRVVGVLRLDICNQQVQKKLEEHLETTQAQQNSNVRTRFFWTFLNQASSLIERTRLRNENMRIELLQRTDALRAALLSSISHDLRTPLTIIKAAASSLQQEDVQWNEEEKRSFALSIEREADRLNRLVGNLLDMSRIENGAIKPEKEWYQLPALITDVVDRLHPLLQGRERHLHFPEAMPPVAVDYLHIDQVLTNLIENAVRYTPATSPIEISVTYNESEAKISVADRGPGIPPQDMERIFDKFYRVLTPRLSGSEPTKTTPIGSGLGLAVCKGLVEAHGGRIWAEAREGGGVSFFVTLPIEVFEGALE